MTRDNITAWLEAAYPDHTFLLADGFEAAFTGVVTGIGREPTACYDRAQCIDLLVERDGLSVEEAEEHFGFNVEGAWMGPQTPVFLNGKAAPALPPSMLV